MGHDILPPARPSPSRCSADSITNSFGLRKKLKMVQIAKHRSPQAKIFYHWNRFSNERNTAGQLLKHCARLNGPSRVFAQQNLTGNTVKYDCALLLVNSNIHLSSQNIRLKCRRNDVKVGESTHAV